MSAQSPQHDRKAKEARQDGPMIDQNHAAMPSRRTLVTIGGAVGLGSLLTACTNDDVPEPANLPFIDVQDQAGSTDSARLQRAIDTADRGGRAIVFIPNTLDLGKIGVTVPQGVHIVTAGFHQALVSYSGSGPAFTFIGTGAEDSRKSGGCSRLGLLLGSNSNAVGVLLRDTRDLDIDVRVFGGPPGLSKKARAACGVRLLYATQDVGCSWNRVHAYVENCDTGIHLDGSAFSPSWVTRNSVSGHVQSCGTGIRLTGASTNDLSVHPQNCTTGWLLDGPSGSDTNDIYTVCENCQVDWTAQPPSMNNRIRGSLGATGAVHDLGTQTTFLNTTHVALPPIRTPLEWDALGGDFVERPMSGELGRRLFYNRGRTGQLVEMFVLDGGGESPKVYSQVRHVMKAGIEFGESGPVLLTGPGSPEGRVDAPVGSMFTRTDGGAASTLYVKESDIGNRGWVPK